MRHLLLSKFHVTGWMEVMIMVWFDLKNCVVASYLMILEFPQLVYFIVLRMSCVQHYQLLATVARRCGS